MASELVVKVNADRPQDPSPLELGLAGQVFPCSKRMKDHGAILLASLANDVNLLRARFVRLRVNARSLEFSYWKALYASRNAFLVLLCLFMCACHDRPAAPRPTIEFTRVPPANEGGPDTLDIIKGRVHGAHTGDQVVLYAKNGAWWVQPLPTEAFTRMWGHSTWVNSTHIGTEYAALLVKRGYHPPATLKALPKVGDEVVAITRAKAGSTSVSKALSFSGYEWRIRTAPSNRGGLNSYSADNAWTDSHGALHLRVAKQAGHWTCAEVSLTRTLGYGTYTFVVHDTSHLQPSVVFSIFTWDYGGQDQNYREMDIEVTHWGDPANKNGQYVVKPFYVPENVARFMEPQGVLTYSFHWEPGSVLFKTVSGPGSRGQMVAKHLFTSGVPSHGVETVRMNLYIYRAGKVSPRHGDEVVVDRFTYLP